MHSLNFFKNSLFLVMPFLSILNVAAPVEFFCLFFQLQPMVCFLNCIIILKHESYDPSIFNFLMFL